MSTSTEISRLQTARNTLRDKGVELGITTNTAKLDVIATAFDGIDNRGAVSAQVQEGDTYTIPRGYHNGSGTVSGVAGGGNYSLQSKTATPTKNQQNITPDSGYYGLSDVTVAAIPEAYQNVSSVDATAADVLTGKIIVTSDGTVTTGTMPNNGTVTKKLDTATTSYTVPKGYHSGTGTVSITTETKSVTPTKSAQTVAATSGKVLSSVSVAAIPDNYIDTTGATAAAAEILDGKTAYVGNVLVEGTMPNNGAVSHTLSSIKAGETSYVIPAGYHNGEGKVSLHAVAKTVVPNKTLQSVTPGTGKMFYNVVVAAIPDEYQDVTGVTATAATVLSGSVFVDASGTEVDGTMANNGATGGSIDGLTTTSLSIPAGYTTGGTVSLTSDIEDALAAI